MLLLVPGWAVTGPLLCWIPTACRTVLIWVSSTRTPLLVHRWSISKSLPDCSRLVVVR
jgi:hypothetical protein